VQAEVSRRIADKEERQLAEARERRKKSNRGKGTPGRTGCEH